MHLHIVGPFPKPPPDAEDHRVVVTGLVMDLDDEGAGRRSGRRCPDRCKHAVTGPPRRDRYTPNANGRFSSTTDATSTHATVSSTRVQRSC
jgi:hypothetical protein